VEKKLGVYFVEWFNDQDGSSISILAIFFSREKKVGVLERRIISTPFN